MCQAVQPMETADADSLFALDAISGGLNANRLTQQQQQQQYDSTSPVPLVLALANAGRRVFEPQRVISDYNHGHDDDILRFASPSNAFIKTYARLNENIIIIRLRNLLHRYSRPEYIGVYTILCCAYDGPSCHRLGHSIRNHGRSLTICRCNANIFADVNPKTELQYVDYNEMMLVYDMRPFEMIAHRMHVRLSAPSRNRPHVRKSPHGQLGRRHAMSTSFFARNVRDRQAARLCDAQL
ncbi:hypothetical protein OUZ56_024911 [Daphnia magna]|uniref:Uncharacterized protein n=1 Tax=Daphnia magna TaxID=35525 RepID=A0ABQ9ZIC5_9CRUS|nr:hypothetical protein OUZ56_024911 [Daphnia magna]